jgi:hypothetical protein
MSETDTCAHSTKWDLSIRANSILGGLPATNTSTICIHELGMVEHSAAVNHQRVPTGKRVCFGTGGPDDDKLPFCEMEMK